MTSAVIMSLLGESINIDSLNMHIKLRVARKAQINNEFFKSMIEILFSFVKDSVGENND
jgi:predicted nucleic acid-binding protein